MSDKKRTMMAKKKTIALQHNRWTAKHCPVTEQDIKDYYARMNAKKER